MYETLRTPGNVYLVEEDLGAYETLERLANKGEMGEEVIWEVMRQLVGVVKALHCPLRVCHRDIKVRVHQSITFNSSRIMQDEVLEWVEWDF